jgi:hypothetical protein
MTVGHCQFLWSSSSSWLCKFPLTLQIIHRYSVCAVQRALCVATGKSNHLILYWETVADYCKSCTRLFLCYIRWCRYSFYFKMTLAIFCFVENVHVQIMFNVEHNYMVTSNFTDDELGKNCWSLDKNGSCHGA